MHGEISYKKIEKNSSFYVNRKPIIKNGVLMGAIACVKALSTSKEVVDKLLAAQNELDFYKKEFKHVMSAPTTFENFVTKEPVMQKVIDIAKKIAHSDYPILILGETGSGKEVMANCVHFESNRKNGPFIKVNCAAIPDTLIESELFGYEEGAFTGSKKGGMKGKFESAHNGTILLDEIGELPLNVQAVLLRVLQEGELEKIGSRKSNKINFRVIAATNDNLKGKVDKSEFRKDLYFRLNVFPIVLPSLRERKSDIPTLIYDFLYEMNNKNKAKVYIDDYVVDYITKLQLPGNIRELKNIVERLYVLRKSDTISIKDLDSLNSSEIDKRGAVSAMAGDSLSSKNNPVQRYRYSNPNQEKDAILQALIQSNYNVSQTARDLGVNKVTIYRKIKTYGIELNRPN
jgi:transcriptional regulator with PAS, ATPase and Fis domain